MKIGSQASRQAIFSSILSRKSERKNREAAGPNPFDGADPGCWQPARQPFVLPIPGALTCGFGVQSAAPQGEAHVRSAWHPGQIKR
jgi:hypothetical protein